MASTVLPFRRPAATTHGATRVDIWRSRVRSAVGRALNRAGVPGALVATTIEDELTGQRLDISVDPLFTRVSVNGRDYYFDRVTGRFDGTGSGCR